MQEPGSVTEWVSRLRSGDSAQREEAARFLWQRYSDDLLRVARGRLNASVRRREDEQDVVQDAFASFCRRHQAGQFVLDNRNRLWRLLVGITLRKAAAVGRRHRARVRDYQREKQLSGAGRDMTEELLAALGSDQPSVQDALILREQFERLLQGLPEELQRITLLVLEGRTQQEVANQLHCSRRSIIRKWEQIRQRARQVFGVDLD